ncbi:MAG: hypothetical protein WAN35_08770 [Terracidiphilus sp.]
MRAKTDEELYLLLRLHSQDYASEAINAASEEFSHRHLDEPTMSRIVTAAENALEERKVMSDTKETGTGFGCLILLCIVGFAIYGGYGWLDSIGWISHREETVITARSDWLVGESKVCWSAMLNSEGAALLGKEVGYAMSSVSCDDGPEHKMKVTFYGKKLQGYIVANWRCTRNEVDFLNDNSFTCYQTGGQR